MFTYPIINTSSAFCTTYSKCNEYLIYQDFKAKEDLGKAVLIVNITVKGVIHTVARYSALVLY